MQRLIPALALAALALAGCRATGRPLNTYVITENVYEVQVDRQNRGLANTISVEGVVSERRDGLLFVQARLQNETSGQVHVEWSVEWYDKSGLLVGEPTAWEPLRLGGGEIETLRKTGPTPEVVSMRLSVRPSDTVK
jgi:uncharacterized protein YcfL